MRTGLVLLLTVAAVSTGFSQVQMVQTVQIAQNRIPQQIIINGQLSNGAYVPAPNGGMQSFTCPNPQEYVTSDGASHGWACFDQTTGVWLLNALPPAPAVQVVPQLVPQPTVIYQTVPPATVVYTQPPVVYAQPVQTVIVQRPIYPSSVVIGTVAIEAAGRIASAAIIGSHHHERYYREHSREYWRR